VSEPPLAGPPSAPDGLHAKGNSTVRAIKAAALGSNRHCMTVSELRHLDPAKRALAENDAN
jgi:hypothetical protein